MIILALVAKQRQNLIAQSDLVMESLVGWNSPEGLANDPPEMIGKDSMAFTDIERQNLGSMRIFRKRSQQPIDASIDNPLVNA